MSMVRIVSCSCPDYWYRDKIGSTFIIDHDKKVGDLFKVLISDQLGEFYLNEKDIIKVSEERNNKLNELGI